MNKEKGKYVDYLGKCIVSGCKKEGEWRAQFAGIDLYYCYEHHIYTGKKFIHDIEEVKRKAQAMRQRRADKGLSQQYLRHNHFMKN